MNKPTVGVTDDRTETGVAVNPAAKAEAEQARFLAAVEAEDLVPDVILTLRIPSLVGFVDQLADGIRGSQPTVVNNEGDEPKPLVQFANGITAIVDSVDVAWVIPGNAR